jgi:adenylate kinase
MNVILLGPPGCGKGTQAERLIHNRKLYYLAAGNLIREQIKKQTKFGRLAKKTILAGKMLPTSAIMPLIKRHLKKSNNILFDGFPRTLEQAEKLLKIKKIHLVINLHISDREVIKRIAKRYMVEKNHHQYTFKSKKDAQLFIKENGGVLFHRKDDTPTVIQKRLKTYHQETEPVLKLFKKKGILKTIDGEKSITAIEKQITRIFSK